MKGPTTSYNKKFSFITELFKSFLNAYSPSNGLLEGSVPFIIPVEDSLLFNNCSFKNLIKSVVIIRIILSCIPKAKCKYVIIIFYFRIIPAQQLSLVMEGQNSILFSKPHVNRYTNNNLCYWMYKISKLCIYQLFSHSNYLFWT